MSEPIKKMEGWYYRPLTEDDPDGAYWVLHGDDEYLPLVLDDEYLASFPPLAEARAEVERLTAERDLLREALTLAAKEITAPRDLGRQARRDIATRALRALRESPVPDEPRCVALVGEKPCGRQEDSEAHDPLGEFAWPHPFAPSHPTGEERTDG